MANEKELIEARMEKLEKIKEYGINPRPEKYKTTHEIGDSRLLEDGTKEARTKAIDTMKKVKKSMKINYFE